jgi:hypothetical protein
MDKIENAFWEKVNKKCKEDIIDIVMDCLHKRATAGETMERIANRCEVTRQLTIKEGTPCRK